MGPMGGIVATAALLAAAGVDAETLERLQDLLRSGNAKAVVTVLQQGSIQEAFQKDAESLATLLETTSNYTDALAEEFPKEAQGLVGTLRSLAEGTLEAGPEDPHALRASAYADVAVARLEGRKGKGPDPAPLAEAADRLEKAYGVDPRQGQDLSAAAWILAEAAAAPKADADALWARVEGLAARVKEAHASFAPTVSRAVLALLERVRWGAGKKERDLEERLEKVVAFLAEPLAAAPDDLDLCTAHNELASVAGGLKLRKLKVPFKTRTVESSKGIQMDIPVSRYWSWNSTRPDVVYQFTPDFRPRRTLVLDNFDWDTAYRMEGGSSVGGDNLKGLASTTFEITCRVYRKLRSKRGLTKAKLRQCDGGWAFEIDGIDGDGEYSNRRAWYFKSQEGRQTTFELTVFSHREDDPTDPAFEAVLESVREKKR